MEMCIEPQMNIDFSFYITNYAIAFLSLSLYFSLIQRFMSLQADETLLFQLFWLCIFFYLFQIVIEITNDIHIRVSITISLELNYTYRVFFSKFGPI